MNELYNFISTYWAFLTILSRISYAIFFRTFALTTFTFASTRTYFLTIRHNTCIICSMTITCIACPFWGTFAMTTITNTMTTTQSTTRSITGEIVTFTISTINFLKKRDLFNSNNVKNNNIYLKANLPLLGWFWCDIHTDRSYIHRVPNNLFPCHYSNDIQMFVYQYHDYYC